MDTKFHVDTDTGALYLSTKDGSAYWLRGDMWLNDNFGWEGPVIENSRISQRQKRNLIKAIL